MFSNNFNLGHCVSLVVSLTLAQLALAQINPGSAKPTMEEPALMRSEQTAKLIGLDAQLQKVRTLQFQRSHGSPVTLEEVSARQELLECIQACALDVDAVLAELSNERSELGDLRTSLQNRRDITVGRLNAAALIAGSGVGAAVSATQFSSFGTRSQNVGDGVGIGAAVASTVLSILAVRRGHGPNASVGDVPNMLAPLLGGTAVLNTRYPSAVFQFLQSVPTGEDPGRGTRLEQLKANWFRAGRLSNSDSVNQPQHIAPLTTSKNPTVRVSISDLDNRIAMLGDVSGRVALMKRDLAELMRSVMSKSKE